MKNNIPIFLSSDNNYAPFVATTIASICDNTNSFCDFYVLDGGITEENKQKICELKKQFNNFTIEFIMIDVEKYFKNFIANSYITIAAYYRFIIPKIFSDIDRFLYLDVDIIVKQDILQLFNEDLCGHIIGAVEDRGDSFFINKLKNNVDISTSHQYFNSGVLLIDNQKWNEQNITNKVFEIEKKYRGRLKTCDQDVLNKVFQNNYKILPDKYNSLNDSDKAIIRHYYSKPKPWEISLDLINNDIINIEHFWYYAKITPFYNELLNRCTIKSKMQINLYKLIKSRK